MDRQACEQREPEPQQHEDAREEHQHMHEQFTPATKRQTISEVGGVVRPGSCCVSSVRAVRAGGRASEAVRAGETEWAYREGSHAEKLLGGVRQWARGHGVDVALDGWKGSCPRMYLAFDALRWCCSNACS